jgi:hypothetical protein
MSASGTSSRKVPPERHRYVSAILGGDSRTIQYRSFVTCSASCEILTIERVDLYISIPEPIVHDDAHVAQSRKSSEGSHATELRTIQNKQVSLQRAGSIMPRKLHRDHFWRCLARLGREESGTDHSVLSVSKDIVMKGLVGNWCRMLCSSSS